MTLAGERPAGFGGGVAVILDLDEQSGLLKGRQRRQRAQALAVDFIGYAGARVCDPALAKPAHYISLDLRQFDFGLLHFFGLPK
jgi:hypothetical protein